MVKNILLGLFVIFMLNLSFASAVGDTDLQVDNYYPAPVQAGDYFNIWLKLANKGDILTKGASIKFISNYPFSLDPDESKEIIIDELVAGKSVIKNFKVRVDSGAKEGDNNIAFAFKDCTGCAWKEKSFPVTIVEAQTMFDVVLQELNTDGVFIAIANIGKNPANAITVKIPEQEIFETQLISASVVGNLESGDYTLVGFKIAPKKEYAKITEEKELRIQIDYTDPLGIRRTVIENIMLKPSSLSKLNSQNLNTSTKQTSSGFFSGFWFWAVIVILMSLTGKKLYKKFGKRVIHKIK